MLGSTIYTWLILSIIILGASISSDAQLPANFSGAQLPKNARKDIILKTNPLAIVSAQVPLTAEYRGMVEFALGNKQSFQVGASYIGKSPLFNTLLDDSMTNVPVKDIIVYGFRLQAAYKFFPFKGQITKNTHFEDLAPFGLYVAPMISFTRANTSTRLLRTFNIYNRADYLNFGLISGYQILIQSFTIDFYSGLGYRNNIGFAQNSVGNRMSVDWDEVTVPLLPRHLKFYLGFNFGWAL